MGAEEFSWDEGTEWINEEGGKDGSGGLNEELGEVEENLKGRELYGMGGHGSAIEVENFQLHLGDG